MMRRFHLPRLPQTPGHHWKLMTAALVTFTIAGLLGITNGYLIAGFAVLLSVGTLAVQWFCIDPPDVDEVDLHGSKPKNRPPS